MNRYSPIAKVSAGLAALNIIAVLFFQFFSYRVLFHSDAATKNILSEEIIRTGSLIPESWYYGNGDIWIIFSHLFIAPLLLFFENSFFVHSMSSLFYDVLLVFVLSYFCYRFHIKREGLFLLVALIFTGLSPRVTENLFGEIGFGYAWGFVFIVFYISVIFSKDKLWESRCRNIEMIGLLVILFFLGMTGIRFLFSGLIPLLGCILLLISLQWMYANTSYRPPSRVAHLNSQQNSTLLYLAIATLMPFLLGLAVNKFYIIEKVSFLDISSSVYFVTFDGVIDNFKVFVEGYLHAGGITLYPAEFSNLYKKPMVSVDGIEMIFRLFFFCIVFFLPWVVLLKNNYNNSRILFLLVAFYCISFFLTLTFFIFTDSFAVSIPAIRYFTLIQVFSALIFIVYINALSNIYGRQLFIPCLVAVLILSVFSWKHLIGSGVELRDGAMKISNANMLDPVLNELKKREMYFGFSSYWHASSATVLSGGDVRVTGVSIASTEIKPFRLLSSEHWYKPSSYNGNSFLLLTNKEAELANDFIGKELGEPELRFNISGFTVLGFSNNIMHQLYDRESQ